MFIFGTVGEIVVDLGSNIISLNINFNQSAGSRDFYPQLNNPNIENNPEPDNNPASLNHEVLNNTPAPIIQLNAPEIIPDGTLRLPDAVRFDGSPTKYQAFMSSMGLYFWARPEVFN
ncbi:hypothetical protein AYI68_g7278, partial [Smittium mucronatum]